jgi:hypothetical protein
MDMLLHAMSPEGGARIVPRLEGHSVVKADEACTNEENLYGSPERKRLGERFLLAALHNKVVRCTELEEELAATKAELTHLTGEMDDMRDDLSDLRERAHVLQEELEHMKSVRFEPTRNARNCNSGSAGLRILDAESSRSQGQSNSDSDRHIIDGMPYNLPPRMRRLPLGSTPESKNKTVTLQTT